MSLVATRAAIATSLRAALGAGSNVHTHGGAVTEGEIAKLGPRTPAVLITCLGFPEAEVQGGTTFADVAFAAFVVTQDQVKDKRDALCLDLAEQVAAHVIDQNQLGRWGGAASGPAHQLVGTNLHTTGLDQKGLSLWLVRWRQRVDLRRPGTPADLVPFETLWATYDIGQTPDTVPTEDDIEVPQ